MIIEWTGMGQIMGGALIGGTVDSTGAVVLAGSALGPEAEQVASLVKMIQNILIGFIAFFVAIFFARKIDKTGKSEVKAVEIWDRFPKFILGFMAVTIIIGACRALHSLGMAYVAPLAMGRQPL